MGLAHRVVPVLLHRGAALYKGKQFQSWRQVGVVHQAVMIHQTRGVDELVLLDISATPEGKGPDFAMVDKLSYDCFMPLTVGGGVRSVEDVRKLLLAGADKVSIGTAGLDDPYLIEECAGLFGRQAIVASIDVNDWVVHKNCGKTPAGYEAVEWAERCEELGAGEVLLTSIDRDGMMNGYDLELIRDVSAAVTIPVIAAGGCGTPQHSLEAIQAGASAVGIGAMFSFTDETPKSVSRYLAEHGLEARLG